MSEPDSKCPPPASPPSDAESLRIDLEKQQAELEKLTMANAALKEELAAAETAEKEVDQVLAAYGQELPTLKSGLTDAEQYLAPKLKMVEAAVGERKDDIDKAIKEYEVDLAQRAAVVDGLEEKKRTTKANHEKAAAELSAARAEFDILKNTAASAAAKLAEFQSLVPRIESEDPERGAIMYFLAQEAKNAKTATKLPSVDQLSTQLRNKLKSLTGKMTAARNARNDWESATIESEKEKKALNDRRAQREERLLKTLQKLDQPSSETTPA